MKFGVVCAILVVGTVTPVAAQDLVYTPRNPSFGGNPLNSSHLLGIANAQKPKPKRNSRRSTADQFVRMLQSRLYSSLATNVSESIFGEGAQDTGSLKLDGLEVAWNNTGTEIEITVFDENNGQTTEITVPTLIQ